MTTDDLAGLLAEHHWDLSEWDVHSPLNLCTCGASIGNNEGDFLAHQAAVIAAAGWRKTEARDEWGIQTPLENGNVWTEVYSFRGVAQRAADRTVRGKLVRRTRLTFNEFTDWEPA